MSSSICFRMALSMFYSNIYREQLPRPAKGGQGCTVQQTNLGKLPDIANTLLLSHASRFGPAPSAMRSMIEL